MASEIILVGGMVALVDDADLHIVSPYNWYLSGQKKYAITNIKDEDGKWHSTSMHRLILGIKDTHKYVDHIDLDGLNNQRSNIRPCNAKENGRNRKVSANNKCGLKGVSWNKKSEKWQSSIKHEGKSRNLGSYENPQDAHIAYCMAAKELHGIFARNN